MALFTVTVRTGVPPFTVTVRDVATGGVMNCSSGCAASPERVRPVEFFAIGGERSYEIKVEDSATPRNCVSRIVKTFSCEYPTITASSFCSEDEGKGYINVMAVPGEYPGERFKAEIRKLEGNALVECGHSMLLDDPDIVSGMGMDCGPLDNGMYRVQLIDLDNNNSAVYISPYFMVDCEVVAQDPEVTSTETDCDCTGVAKVTLLLSAHNGDETTHVYEAYIEREDPGIWTLLNDSIKTIPPNVADYVYTHTLPKTSSSGTSNNYRLTIRKSGIVLSHHPFTVSCETVQFNLQPSFC